MQNFGQNTQRTSILKELSNGNVELGEGFAQIINVMVVQSGITNPRAEVYDVVPDSWRKLAAKPDKTLEDIKRLDTRFKDEIFLLAESYLLYMARETRNLTGQLDYNQYETFMLKYRFGHYDVMNRPEYLTKVKAQIKNAFNKIANHGEKLNDTLIDKKDMSAYLFALSTKTSRDANNKFTGFEINGLIKPEDYAVNERLLFEPEDNLFSIKLRVAYKTLYQ